MQKSKIKFTGILISLLLAFGLMSTNVFASVVEDESCNDKCCVFFDSRIPLLDKNQNDSLEYEAVEIQGVYNANIKICY